MKLEIIIIIIIFLISTLYARNSNITVKSKLDYYTDEQNAEIMVEVPKEGNNLTIKLNNQTIVKNIEIKTTDKEFYPIPLKMLKKGNNMLNCIFTKAGNRDTIAVNIKKLPHRENCVKVNKITGSLVVDGLPFIPVGFYNYWPIQPDLAEQEVVKGFNMMSPYQKIIKKDLEKRKAYMDRCAELGMKVNYNLCSLAGGGGVGSDRLDISEKEMLKLLLEEVIAFKDHPALLSWYISDEPVLQKQSPRIIQKAYKLIKKIDPYHPITIVFMRPEKADKFVNSLDIIMTDPYVIPMNSVTVVGDKVGNLKKKYGAEKSIWIVPQAFGGSEWWKREPTKQEIRVMTYLAVLKGARGIQYFIRHGLNSFPKSTAMWAECGEIALEIAELTPFLVSSETAPVVSANKKNIEIKAYKKDNEIVIAAINTENKPQQYEFSFSNKAFDGSLEVMFESRSIEIKNGKAEGIIGAYGTRIYKFTTEKKIKNAELLNEQNLTNNPSFENNPSVGVPSGCYAKISEDKGATYFVDSRVSLHGSHSLRMISPKEKGSMRLFFYPMQLKKGENYSVSIWAKAKDAKYQPDKKRFFLWRWLFGKRKKKNLSFRIYLAGNHKTFELTEDWKEYVLTFPMNRDLKRRINLRVVGKGTVWFDLMQVYPTLNFAQEFKNNQMQVKIDTPLQNIDIHYTTDQTIPDSTSALYSKPIDLSKTTVLKVAFFKDNEIISDVFTHKILVHKAMGKKIIYNTNYQDYSAGGDNALIDGKIGSSHYKDGRWQSFIGKNMDVIIDLGKIEKINTIETHFLQKISSWIFLPEYVKFSISTDKKNYQTIATLYTKTPKKSNRKQIETYKVTCDSKGRYLRVIGKSIKVCPNWHKGAGKACYIFVDEIIVE